MPRLALTQNTAGRLRRPPRAGGNATGLAAPPSPSPSFSRQHRRNPSMALSFSPPRRPPPLQEMGLQSPPSSPGKAPVLRCWQ